MTQGYGQQPQWDQGGQNPPPSPAPQWGQPSPAPGYPGAPGPGAQGPGYPGAPGPGYPGAPGPAGAPQFAPAEQVNWGRVKLLGITLLVGSALLLLVRLGVDLASLVMAENLADESLEPGGVAIGASLVTILLFIANIVLSLVVIGVGIAAAVIGRGRARVGGIVVAASIPVSVVLYWILSFVVGFIAGAMAFQDPAATGLSATTYRVSSGIDMLRVLVMGAVMLYASFLVYSTARRKLGA
ncbi:hypothetical protein [Brachybacterium sp. YJGR34]|uniref:hypothetical protein n=1 Tax=Brachybacterium sp. YJGR34 TaxID=2059911 RepID=UPI001E398AAB|nr:hypothetical protein [Brachybacterium sp. YJGR34]